MLYSPKSQPQAEQYKRIIGILKNDSIDKMLKGVIGLQAVGGKHTIIYGDLVKLNIIVNELSSYGVTENNIKKARDILKTINQKVLGEDLVQKIEYAPSFNIQEEYKDILGNINTDIKKEYYNAHNEIYKSVSKGNQKLQNAWKESFFKQPSN